MPVLIGTVAEAMSEMGFQQSIGIRTEADYVNAVTAVAGAGAPYLLALYPASDYHSPRQAYNAINAGHTVTCLCSLAPWQKQCRRWAFNSRSAFAPKPTT